MAGAVEVGHRDGVRVAEEQSAGDVLGHLVEGARGEQGPGAQGGEQRGRVERAGHGVHVRVAEDDADGLRTVRLGQGGQGAGDRLERLVPARLRQGAVPADERGAQPVGVGVEPADGGALGADEAMAEDVRPVAPGGGDPGPLDGEAEPAGGLAEGADAQGGTGVLGSFDMGPPRGDGSDGART